MRKPAFNISIFFYSLPIPSRSRDEKDNELNFQAKDSFFIASFHESGGSGDIHCDSEKKANVIAASIS